MFKLFTPYLQILISIKNTCTIIFILIACSLAATSFADELDPLAKWYQIEYVIFEHRQTDDHILRYEDTPYPKRTKKQFSYVGPLSNPASPYQYTQLNEDKMDLEGALRKLRRSRDVAVLDAKAWQQPLTDTHSPPIKIQALASQERTLFGELHLKKSRYTHAEFKLFLAKKISVPYENIQDWFLTQNTNLDLIDLLTPINDQLSLDDSIGISELFQNVRYLGESRRIKEGEVHYIDHPVISVIITIKEIPSPYDIRNQ